MKKLIVHLRQTATDVIAVGQLAESGRRIFFEYDPAFIERGMELSPFKLPLRGGLVFLRVSVSLFLCEIVF